MYFLVYLGFDSFCYNIVYEEQDKGKVGRRERGNRRKRKEEGRKREGKERRLWVLHVVILPVLSYAFQHTVLRENQPLHSLL